MLLAIIPDGAPTDDVVPTAGSWERVDGGTRFAPRFPAVPGTSYLVLGRAAPGDPWRELARVEVPASAALPSTTVVAIDPGVDAVPANLLRFAVSFSSAMDEGSAAGRIHLLDDAGTELRGALLEMPPELWDRDRRRLTVLLEPGRVKRGLQPNVQAGAPLLEGGTVTIVVDEGIRDAAGLPLAAGARRSYRVGPSIRARIDPALWGVSRERETLVVRFDRPLDPALVRRCLRVLDADGNAVPGRASFDQSAQRWSFTSESGGDWALRIDTSLEDLAGNSVRRVFDRDLQRSEDDGIDDLEIVIAPRDTAS